MSAVKLVDPDGKVHDGARLEYLVRHVFLDYSPIECAREWYVASKISVEELEMLLDAVLLQKGCEAAVKCPRCGARVKGIGATSDKSMIAVRCPTPDCNFVGYAEA